MECSRYVVVKKGSAIDTSLSIRYCVKSVTRFGEQMGKVESNQGNGGAGLTFSVLHSTLQTLSMYV